ncbi:MAG: endonuclease MutS2 [Myxococcota bacterium]
MLDVTADCLRDLGWPRVRAALSECCATELARRRARALPFCEDPDHVRRTMDRVAELVAMRERDAEVPLDGLDDIRSVVDLCRRRGVADAESLTAVARTATHLGRLSRWLREHADEVPAVAEAATGLTDLTALGRELARTFDETGRVRDDASPELAAARRRLARHQQDIKARLDRWVHRAEVEELLQDEYYTVREDRYVVPVTASFQGQVPGIIHGTSNTGQTVYVEPEGFIAANNELKLAAAEADNEERRVLVERSNWVAEEAHELLEGLERATDLDLLHARAVFGERWDAHLPAVSDRGRMWLHRVRNPLLLFKDADVVPNDVELDEQHAFVLITGPNTGGKTVTLNTIGLTTLMAWVGLPIPAEADSRVVLFHGLHAIIGDPQDIQRDLSTFSGHIHALRALLEHADRHTLVLLDELIVGTEPERGAALAIAVLEALAERGVRGFVTTHYERLKTLAYDDARFANARVGIDPRTLRPTYVLAMGAPGASSPFEIAERLGFDGDILARARAISVGHEGLGEAVGRLESARERAERELDEARKARREAEQEAARLEGERERLRREADAEVKRMRREVLAEARSALEVIRHQVAEVQRSKDPRELERRRRQVLELEHRVAGEEAEDEAPPPPRPAPSGSGPGDGGDFVDTPASGRDVWVRPLRRPGQVVEPRGDRLLVAVGGLRMTVEADQVGRLRAGSDPPRSEPAVRVEAVTPDADGRTPPPQMEFNSLDLRGLRRDEVPALLEPFLDRAFRAGEDAVWIIHGRGTGALREEVRERLALVPYVTTWRPGDRYEGGDGVTIAWLEQR